MGLMGMDPAHEMRVVWWLDENGLTVDCRPLTAEQRAFRHEMAQRWGRWWNAWPWEEELWAKLRKQDHARDLVAAHGWQSP